MDLFKLLLLHCKQNRSQLPTPTFPALENAIGVQKGGLARCRARRTVWMLFYCSRNAGRNKPRLHLSCKHSAGINQPTAQPVYLSAKWRSTQIQRRPKKKLEIWEYPPPLHLLCFLTNTVSNVVLDAVWSFPGLINNTRQLRSQEKNVKIN